MRPRLSTSRILVRHRRTIGEHFRQAIALLLIAVMPSASLPVSAALPRVAPQPASAVLPSSSREASSSSSSHAALAATNRLGPVFAMPQSGLPNGIAVSVAYADNLTSSMNFPTPWQGVPNVSFYGAGPNFNAGAVRLDNTTSSTVTVDSVSVDMQRPGPTFSLWTNITIPANGSAILTQTSAYNFDTSSFPIVSCGGTIPANDTRIPKITVTQGGTPTNFLDTSHVLDTGGFDLSCRGNRSLAWRPIGTTGIEAPSAGITASPDGSITETGVAVALGAQAVDADGQPLANAPVTFLVKSGPNSGKTTQATTNAQGTAAFSYASATAGSDSIQASLTNLTNTSLNSTPITANWTSAGPCPPPSASSPGGTSLIYVGQTAVHVGDSFQAGALLIDGSGNGISGQTISFKFLSFTNSATTDSNGVARLSFIVSSAVATSVSASFPGTTNYSASSTSSAITIAQENTEIIYTGPTLLSTGSAQQLTAKLTDLHHNAPLANKTLTFQVGSLQATAVTNSSGIATASVTLTSSQTTGPGQIQVSFAGDANYQPSFTSLPVIIALSSSFVIWGGNSGGLHLGQDVNFWGAQWASQVTGGNFTANPSFKGYAQNVTAWQLCEVLAGSGQQTLDANCWSTKPGNSNPPATVPQYIEVIVSTAISKQGSEIYGNIASLAVLKVDSTPVYGPDPGHPGNGTIVAVMQDGGHVFPTPSTLSAAQSQAATVLPGQTYGVATQVTNSGQTTASNVVVTESFDGTQPATGSQSDASLATSGQFAATFSETAPTYPMRQTNESSTAYETRLAGVDGRRFTSTGMITHTDSVGQPYLPLNVTSYSTLQLPRLDVSLRGPACVSPAATVPYVVTITNIGSAAATSVTATLTLPDGSTRGISASNLAPGTSSVSTVNFQLAALTPEGTSETAAQYLARLAAADGTLLTASAGVIWQDAQGNNYGTVTQQVSSTTQRVPILSETPTAPTTILPGSTAVLNFSVQNTGSGNAVETDLTVANPDGTTSRATPFSLNADSTATASATWKLPAVQAKQASETDAAYQNRLTGLDNGTLTFKVSLAWKDASGGKYGPTTTSVQSTRVLPIIAPTMSGPASANVGDKITYSITLQNMGHISAAAQSLSVTLPDGTTTTPTLPPGGLAAGASVQTTVQYTVPSSQSGVLIAAQAHVSWTDSIANNYGPLSAVATTQVVNASVPPIVSAGQNQAIELPTNSITLQGSVTPGRPGSNPTSLWTESSGPGAVNFANQSQPVTTAIFPASGTYVLKLTATDGTLSGSASVTIVVAPFNQPPSVTVGPDQTIAYPVNTANLTGTVTDDGFPIGSHLVISWSVVTGPGTVNFASPSQPNTQAAFSQAGNYVLRLTASDGQYSSAGDVRVAFNAPPGGGISVTAGANQVVAMPGPVALKGSASDSNPPTGSTLTVNWTEVSGPGTVAFAAANSAVTTVTFTVPGVYVLRLTATNGTYTASSDATIYAGQLQCMLGNKSTDFWLMFIGAAVSLTNTTPPRQISLFISSDTTTSGTVSIPGQGLNFAFTVTPGQITTVDLPQSVMMTTSDLIEAKGIHVTAQNSIAIYGLNFVPAATDGFMGLPTTSLGTSYFNLGYSNTGSGRPDNAYARGTEFGIAATQDNTTVTIVPTANAGAREARHPYSVTLNQGQTYQLRNSIDFVDLTGTAITSDKPVAVFGGHDCAFVPDQNEFCNHLVEQLPPVNLWGQHFVSISIAQERYGDTYRFLAQTDNTHVQINGQQVAQINQGEFFETIFKGRLQIDADQPILVAEYSNSSTFNQTTNIDPTMILIPPFEQFGGSYTINTPTSNFSTNYINVVAATAATQAGLVNLDGSSLPGSAFQPIGPSPFSGAQITVGVGAHTLSSSLPFGIYAYGFNTYDNYGYAGGACFAKGVSGSTLAASPKTTSAPVTSQACVQAKVTDPSGNPVGGTGVTFKVAGVNSTTSFVTTDATGTATFCYTSLVSGSDLITITAGKASDTASIIWVTNGPNQPPIVSAGPNLTVSLPTNSAYLNGSVIDDGLPAGGTLTQAWSEVSGPAVVTFATPTQPQTSVTFPQAGTYFLQLMASDSQLSTTSAVTVTVYPPNQPPVVSAGTNQTLIYFVNTTDTVGLNGSATDDGLPAGSTLAINWSLVSGPDLVSFSSANTASTTVRLNSPGSYVFQLSANDSQYTAKSYVTVNSLGPVTTNLTPNGSMQAVVGTLVTLDPNLLVGGAPPAPGIPLKAFWSVYAVPPGGQVTFGSPNAPQTTATFSQTGTYNMSLPTTDVNYNAGINICCLSVNVVQTATPLPVISLASPADGAEITSPTTVTGSVSDGNWTLEYALQDDFNPMIYVPFATGTGTVYNGTLGTLDPTLLLNGTYSIRLQSTNITGAVAVATTVNVTRNMKIGAFTLSFNDMSVALPGLPIQIIRTYDSRDKGIGDFGVGWRMSLTNARLQKNHILGRSWQETAVAVPGQVPVYCLQPTTQKIVTISFPDGKVYRFQASTDQSCILASPITAPTMTFTQMPTSSNTAGAALVPQDGGAVLVDGSIPGPVSLDGYDGLTYNPTAFTLTTADGAVYSIDQKLGVTRIRDTNGNTLTITVNGITHSSGRSIAFERDTLGRVTRINDPDGNPMYYAYGAGGNLGSYTDRQLNVTSFSYNNSNDLTGIVTPDGKQALTNTYDSSGRLTLTKDALGIGTAFTPNLAQQTETISDRNGNPTTYTYDTDGNVVQTKDALGHISSATYDSSDNKLSETNALGKTTTYTYDTFGSRLTESDPLGHTTSYTYNQFQRVLTVTDPNQHTTTNTYDTNGNLLTTTDTLGHITTNTYGGNGLLVSTKDALNHTSSFGYDSSGNLTSQTDAAGTVTSYTYDANGNRLTQSVTRTLPAGQGGGTQALTTTFVYDNLNRVVKTIYPDGSNTLTVYNVLGQQTATIDALGHGVGYAYDSDGRVTNTYYADSSSEYSEYDGNGNRTRFKERSSVLTFYTFDGLNRLVQTRNNNTGALTSTTYDAVGQALTAKDPNGNVTQYAYDDAGRRTTLTNALNQVTSFGYDAAGNQTSVLDALSHTTSYAYDAANRRTQVTYPDSTFETTAYDALGRVTSRTDANGKTTQYGYDVLGRLTSVTDALNQATSYTYDEVGNRLTQADANAHATSYQYDQRGRRTRRTLPLGQTEAYTYDGNGNMFTKTDFNARTTTYTYDTMNRLLSKIPDASFHAASVTFTYTASGKRATMGDGAGGATYSYGGNDQLQQKRSPFGVLSYSYDLAGNLTSGGNASYGYDGLNRLAGAYWSPGNGSQFASYSYDAVGNLASVTYSNGVVHTYSYDAKNRLTNLGVNGTVNGAAGPIAGYAYAVDAAGHRTSVADLSGRTVNYAYDNLYRLTSETIAADPAGMNGAVSFSYDAVGNRTQRVSTLPGYPGGLSNYNANDQLATDAYDAEGNTTASNGNGYVYDFENRLIQQGGNTYSYDGDGNRVQKFVAGVYTNYLVDPLNPTGYAQVLTENYYNGTGPGEVQHRYLYGLERLSEVRDSTPGNRQYIFYVYDGHGSVRALTDQSGNVTDTYDYDAFGTLIHSTGTTYNNYLFAGEQFDPDLGLYFNRARYLNTSTGRFVSQDPNEGRDEDPVTLHRYLYAGDDPANNDDPSGEDFSIAEISTGLDMMNTLNAMPQLNFSTTLQNVPRVETLYVRAFAPWKRFGLGFAGDDRSFTTSLDKSVTSRVVGVVTFLLPTVTKLSEATYSDPSHNPFFKTKTGNPTMTATAGGGAIHLELAAANPLVFSADIDVKLDMSIQVKGSQACYNGRVYGDAFPDVEAFVVNQKEQATMLDEFVTSGGQHSGPYIYLPRNNNRPMGDFSKCAAE